jgi:hypothetical protein
MKKWMNVEPCNNEYAMEKCRSYKPTKERANMR